MMEKFKEIDWDFCKRWAKLSNFEASTNEISFVQFWRNDYFAMIFAYDDLAYVYVITKKRCVCPFEMSYEAMLSSLPIQWKTDNNAKLEIIYDPFSKELKEEILFKPSDVKRFDETDVIRVIEYLNKRIPK
ncbi:MAG: hypothetical protein DRN91_08745 [Candidatus Alkanophagales archaeon]|nr:MAG: hypothetical protein DRN91_08745 [Candidatus Alkanophagales archaeon]